MEYVVGLGLQNPELTILFKIGPLAAEILNVKVREINNFNNVLFIFFIFFKSLVANMAANLNKIEKLKFMDR